MPAMAVIVQKYGGSSVADVDKLGLVADLVVATKRAGHDVVVVVSAMGGTTDQLLAMAKAVDDNPPRRELDMLLTTGERVSMALLSMAIQRRGCDAISFTGSQSGIITNDRHFDARIIEVRPHRVEDEIHRGRVVIIAGFQGMSYRREITTLGRGGSDTTALAMAAALGAERAEIYSDVDGVYTADPRLVRDAEHLPEIGYEEMLSMAHAGAKVLHAGAVEVAKRAKVAIHARATFKPGRETVVHGAGSASPTTAIVSQGKIARVQLRNGEPALRQMLAVAAELLLPVQDLETREEHGSFIVPTAHVPDWTKARDLLRAIPGCELEESLAVVCAVGIDMGRDHEAFARAVAALDDAAIPRLAIRTSPLKLSFTVAASHEGEAVRVLHRALVP